MTLGVGVGIGIGFYRDIIAFATQKADPDTEMLRARFEFPQLRHAGTA
jgi:hypothetical protein